MTRVWFDQQMARMAGLRFAPAETDTHWEGLRDLPSTTLEAAVSRAVRTRSEFPTPVELRQDADIVARPAAVQAREEDRGVELPTPVTIGTLPTGTRIVQTRIWKYYHEACSDSGADVLWCGEPDRIKKPWQELQHCGRTAPHGPHEWVRKCTCWDSNPALLRKRTQQQKFAETGGKGRSA